MSTYTVRPLFDQESSTWTYILSDKDSEKAAIIDPVLEQFERDQELIKEMGVTLSYILETHVHADHITGAAKLKDLTGASIAYSSASNVIGADRLLDDKEEIRMGNTVITTLTTPGHTNSCVCFYVEGAVFTGDTLFIRGCGRTDFQEGSSERLYDSVHEKLFVLDDDTLVYPSHNYKGMLYSTIGEEKKHNPRLKEGITKAQFVDIMNELDLSPPKKMAVSVSANQKAGRHDEVA